MIRKNDTGPSFGRTKRWLTAAALSATALCSGTMLLPQAAQSEESVLRVAMTAADIPVNIGQPDQGFEGFQFAGRCIHPSRIIADRVKEFHEPTQ